MVVSVVDPRPRPTTRNGFIVRRAVGLARGSVGVRVRRTRFHASTDGEWWHLGSTLHARRRSVPEVGFAVQSPRRPRAAGPPSRERHLPPHTPERPPRRQLTRNPVAADNRAASLACGHDGYRGEPACPKSPRWRVSRSGGRRRWQEEGTYAFDRSKERADVYAIDTPPPTVSGALHIGHVFSYTHTDLVARFQRMRGKAVFYPIGWDDNGLPTERRVQNHFGVRCDPSLPYDPVVHAAGEARPEAPGADLPAQLRRAVHAG